MSEVRCAKCGRSLLPADLIASISGSIMGDEHTDSYFACPACGLYTVESWWDNFTGVESATVSGPLDRAEGDARISLIRQCPQSWDKHCRCEAHRAYFNETLD